MSLYNNDFAAWLGLCLMGEDGNGCTGWLYMRMWIMCGTERLIDRPSVLADVCECIRGHAAHRQARVVVWADDHPRDGNPPRRRCSSVRFARPRARRRPQRHALPMDCPPPGPVCRCLSHRQTGNCPPHRKHRSGSCVSVRPCWCCRRRRSQWEQDTATAMKVPISQWELGNSWGALTYLNMLRVVMLNVCWKECWKEDAWVATDCHGPARCGFYMAWIRSALLCGKRVLIGFPLLIAAIGNYMSQEGSNG